MSDRCSCCGEPCGPEGHPYAAVDPLKLPNVSAAVSCSFNLMRKLRRVVRVYWTVRMAMPSGWSVYRTLSNGLRCWGVTPMRRRWRMTRAEALAQLRWARREEADSGGTCHLVRVLVLRREKR